VPGGNLPFSGSETYVWSTGVTGPSITVQTAGAYWVKAVTSEGCETKSTDFQVTVQGSPFLPTVGGGQRCDPGEVTLTAAGGLEGGYRWYSSPSDPTPLPGATGSTFTTPVLQSSATYYVSILSNGCESARAPVRAAINAPPAANAGPDQSIWWGQGAQLYASGGASYQWQPAAGLSNPQEASPVARPTETTTYTVTVTSADGCTAQDEVTVTVLRELTIPNAFSPNGDGVNESWEIENMLSFPAARVEIFNRWGSRIFDTTGYRNDWGGTYKGSPLPVGTYFYVITIDQSRKLTGPVSIVR
jgi:gliding motility-associated-like protein